MYKESNEASEGGDYDTLVKVAGKLGFEDVTENEFYLEKTVKKLSEKDVNEAFDMNDHL